MPSLEHLLEAGFEVPLVVTRPDRPLGRHAAPRPSPVARWATARRLPTEKPETLRGNASLQRRLGELSPDAVAIVAYGRMLPREILLLPRLGCVNVHASLLPRWRGASPIQAALLAGDRETGVVTMRMEEKLDAGPLYLERRFEIEEREDAGALSRRLAREGAELLVETLRGLAAGRLVPRPQVGEPSFCRPLAREDGQVDWSHPAEEIERRLRAFTPWPGLHTFLEGKRIKIVEAQTGPPVTREPGTLWAEGNRALVAAGGGTSLVLARVQRAGGKELSGVDFLRGLPALPARFGADSSGAP